MNIVATMKHLLSGVRTSEQVHAPLPSAQHFAQMEGNRPAAAVYVQQIVPWRMCNTQMKNSQVQSSCSDLPCHLTFQSTSTEQVQLFWPNRCMTLGTVCCIVMLSACPCVSVISLAHGSPPCLCHLATNCCCNTVCWCPGQLSPLRHD